jgi:hypothetical protein
MHKESDSWRKNNTRMGGRPNVGRVRVLVIHCKWMKSPIIYKYRYAGII